MWPVFNVADSAIVVGAILIGLASLRSGGQVTAGSKEKAAEDA